MLRHLIWISKNMIHQKQIQIIIMILSSINLRVSKNVDQPVPVVTAVQPIPNQTTRKFTFRRPVMTFIGN